MTTPNTRKATAILKAILDYLGEHNHLVRTDEVVEHVAAADNQNVPNLAVLSAITMLIALGQIKAQRDGRLIELS